MKNEIQPSTRITHGNTAENTTQHTTTYLTQVMNNQGLMLEIMSSLSDNEEPDSLFRTITDQSNKGEIFLKGNFLHLILTFRWLYDLIYIKQDIKVQIQSRVSDFTATISQVQWLINTTLFDFPGTSLINNAASRGSLDVIKWAREQNPPYPWEDWTCTNAAAGGHLEVLKWLRAQNPPCPWNKWTLIMARLRGHLDIVQWLRAQNPPCPWNAITQNSNQGFFYAASTKQHPETNRSGSSITLR